MSLEQIIERESVRSFEKLIGRVRNLEDNDYYRPVSFTGTTSNPPTQVELDGILGTPSSYNSEIVALVRDTTNDRNWLCFGDTVSNDWYFIAVDNVYKPGYNRLGTPTTITSNASFSTGFFTVPSVPPNAIAVDITINLIAPSAGLYVTAHPNPGATGVTNNIACIAQVAGLSISENGTTGVTISSGNAQVYLTRAAPLTTLSVKCMGFYI